MDLRRDLLAIVRAAIVAAGGRRLLRRALDELSLARAGGSPLSDVPLVAEDPGPFLRVIAAGKAAPGMAAVAAERFGSRVRAGLVVSHVPAAAPQAYESIVAGHPIPTAESERAGRLALEMAESIAPDETLLVLLSGGASALMAVPADGVTLEDKRATTERLLRAGADIQALNTVRKHLSAIKGGRLAATAGGCCVGHAISDVIGDDVGVIASGPTVVDVTTYADALDVLRRFGGRRAIRPPWFRDSSGASQVTPPRPPSPGTPVLPAPRRQSSADAATP